MFIYLLTLRNLKIVSLFVFVFVLACERIFIKLLSIEGRCVTGPENIVRSRVHASFSPEVLHVGAVKGLRTVFASAPVESTDRTVPRAVFNSWRPPQIR